MCGNGRIVVSDKRKVLGHKPMYRLDFSANQIRHLLPQIQKYLRIKNRQADVLLRFLATKHGGKKSTDEEWQQQEDLRAEIRTLNKRGLTDTSPEVLVIRPKVEKPERFCELQGCRRLHYGRGYCWIHYKKYIQRGGPVTHQRVCEVCGSGFETRRADTRCCSKDCTDKRYYRMNAERIKAQVAAAKERRKQIA
jgi:hypothetical protein